MMRFLICALVLTLAGCASLGGPPGAKAPTGPPIPSGPLDLGDYAKESEAKVLADFSNRVARRYAEGAPLARAVEDLVANKFACAPPKTGPKGAAGDPPDQVCRRVLKAGGCEHTYQVHLFDDDGGKATIARVRGLYDRACGGDELLGGV